VAKIAGGAQMFAFQSNNATMRVGDRNVAASLKKIKGAKYSCTCSGYR